VVSGAESRLPLRPASAESYIYHPSYTAHA
jgi:hypothetical protein